MAEPWLSLAYIIRFCNPFHPAFRWIFSGGDTNDSMPPPAAFKGSAAQRTAIEAYSAQPAALDFVHGPTDGTQGFNASAATHLSTVIVEEVYVCVV